MCNFPLLARHTPVNLGQPSADKDCPLGLWVLQGRHWREPAPGIGWELCWELLGELMVLFSLKWSRNRCWFLETIPKKCDLLALKQPVTPSEGLMQKKKNAGRVGCHCNLQSCRSFLYLFSQECALLCHKPIPEI